MPIEKRPVHLVPKGPPHGTRSTAHKVGNDETFESVARQHKIPVKQLVFFNFGTLQPAELNWYLREYVGCNLATRDHKNWRFSASAKPGIIYIPEKVLREKTDIIFRPVSIHETVPEVDLTMPGGVDFLPAVKFVQEVPLGETTFRTVLVKGKMVFEGELKQKSGVLKFSVKKDQVKLALELKIAKELKLAFGAKFEEKVLSGIEDAVKKGDKGGIAAAVASAFDISVKESCQWKILGWEIPGTREYGLEFSKTPFFFKASGDWEDQSFFLERTTFFAKFSIKFAFNVGLSAAGWKWGAEKTGPQVLKRVLMQGGKAMAGIAEWLVSEAVLTAGFIAVAAAAMFGLAYLAAWSVADARNRGTFEGLATWYCSAYASKVFGDPRPSGSVITSTPEENKRRKELMDWAEKDAVTDARAAAGPSSDAEALAAMRDVWTHEGRGNPLTGKNLLRERLQPRAVAIAMGR